MRKFLITFAGLIALLMQTVIVHVHASDDDMVSSGRVPMPKISQGKGDQCVEPTDIMRVNHMEFILHQRDRTVHEGFRVKQHSLKECIGCHVERDAKGQSLPVNGEGQFCHSCHEYAAVTIDCFGCHATTPEGGLHNTGGHTSALPTSGAASAMPGGLLFGSVLGNR